jgi:GH24 family phage-related lysozyme (muramidase)
MSKLVEMIKRHEGVKSKIYLCSAGYETIGVGSTALTKRVKMQWLICASTLV